MCVLRTQTASGKSSLDKIYVDHLFIRTDNLPPALTAAPTNLTAAPASATQIDLVLER